MFKATSTAVLIGVTATFAQAGEIVNDDFSFPAGTTGQARLDRTVWTNGGGFLVTDAETLLISTFGTGFGNLFNSPNASPNSAPLNSQTGYASMDILSSGPEIPLEGNFLIANGTTTNTANALLDIRFGDGAANDGSGRGAGSYEFVWNNSDTLAEFSLPSGYSGTVGSGTWIGVRDGDTANPFFGQTDAPANVNVGDAGISYHFWGNQPNETMIVDNVVIWDSIPMLTSEIAGDYNDSGLVEQGDLDQVLANWGAGFASIPATWINQRPTEGIVDQAELDVVLTEWGSSAAPDFTGSAVPEPASLVLLGLGGLAALRRRQG